MKTALWALMLSGVMLFPITTNAMAASPEGDNGNTADVCQHTSHDTWTEWTDDDSLPTDAGHYYLSTDVTITSVQKIDNIDNKEVVLCLNGHNVTLGASYGSYYEAKAASLVITDCSTSYGTITDVTASGDWGRLTAKDLHLDNISLALHVSDDNGTPFYINEDDSLTIQNCDIDITVQTVDESALGFDFFVRSGFNSTEDKKASVLLNNNTIDIELDVSQTPELSEDSSYSVEIIDNLENSSFKMNGCELSFSCSDSHYYALMVNCGTMEVKESRCVNFRILNGSSSATSSTLTIQASTLLLGKDNGIFNRLGKLSFDGVEYSGDTISNEGGEVTITSCEITGNILNDLELDGQNANGVVSMEDSTICGQIRTGKDTVTNAKGTSVATTGKNAVENAGSMLLESCTIDASGLQDIRKGAEYLYTTNSAAIYNMGSLTLKGGSVRAAAQKESATACIYIIEPATVSLNGAPVLTGGYSSLFINYDILNNSDVILITLGSEVVPPTDAKYTISGNVFFLGNIVDYYGKPIIGNVEDSKKDYFELVSSNENSVLVYNADTKTLDIGVSSGNTDNDNNSGDWGENGGGDSGTNGEPGNSVTPPVPTPPTEVFENPFSDVKEGEYYYDAVLWAVENNITYGVSAEEFGPELSCTRGEIVTFLWRIAGCPVMDKADNIFCDVEVNSYCYDAVIWAAENGITMGVGDDAFGTDTVCTRSQIVTMLYRYAGSPVVEGGEMKFIDVSADSYYGNAVQWAIENNITIGTSDTTFEPDADCTRGEIVTFLYRAFAAQ